MLFSMPSRIWLGLSPYGLNVVASKVIRQNPTQIHLLPKLSFSLVFHLHRPQALLVFSWASRRYHHHRRYHRHLLEWTSFSSVFHLHPNSHRTLLLHRVFYV